MLELSVVIPAYNEEKRLPATLLSICGYLKEKRRMFEVVVVDDGSLDNTQSMVRSLAKEYPEVKLISYAPNHGKGYAVRAGVLACQGKLVLVDDADGSSPIYEIERLEKAILDGADVVIGSRAKPDPSRTVKALPHRKYIGNTFNLIVQSLLLPGLLDTQCGFKLFSGRAARKLFSLSRLDGYAFDVEVLYIARLYGFRVDEVAIDWTNVEGSKVRVVTDSPRMLVDVLGIAWRSWLGRYRALPDIQCKVQTPGSAQEQDSDSDVGDTVTRATPRQPVESSGETT